MTSTGRAVGRRERRSEIARFKRVAERGAVSYLIEPTDPRLAGERLLRNALNYWRAGVSVRKPKCFACKAPFTSDGEEPGAFLMVTAAVAPTSASVSALCVTCWRGLPDDELERHAARCLRPVLPNGVGNTSENP
jgi:hypothetical protein